MKIMAGARLRACSNRSLTRAAPTPTNISTNSEPEIEKNGTLASPATAFASSVFPVPGQQYTLWHPAPEAAVPLGIFQKLDDLAQLVLGLIHTGHVVEAH